MGRGGVVSRVVPEHLRAAWIWTRDAGELAALAKMSKRAARAYAADSAANAAKHAEHDVAASDLLDLRDWLREVSA